MPGGGEGRVFDGPADRRTVRLGWLGREPPQSCLVGVRLLIELIGDRGAVMRELCREAPLVRHGLVRVHATGAIVASSPVIARLAS